MTIPTRKEAFETIKNLLNLKFETALPAVAAVDPVAATTTDYTLADGTVIAVDTLQVGGIVTKDGAPVADGEYITQDGTKLKTVGGLITELEAPEPAADPAAPVANGIAEAMKKMKADIEQMKKELGSYATAFEAVVKENATLREANTKTVELLETIGNEPIEKPIEKQTVVTEFQKFQSEKTARVWAESASN